mmetsp:Transcript_46176/g.91534  ORF Transcript_46176/g.91534 Transcript_46176/m.91534 type:complete len:384 (+) Transcript_46176:68-1219(+)
MAYHHGYTPVHAASKAAASTPPVAECSRVGTTGLVSPLGVPPRTPSCASKSKQQDAENAGQDLLPRNITEDGLGEEGTIRALPRLAKSRPSDRAARRKALEGRLRVAHEQAAAESCLPLCHGRFCLLVLLLLEILRIGAWWQGSTPGPSVMGMHFLTTTSDISCLLCATPLFATGTKGQCVALGCLGPMLTLVFAMSLVDISALGAYLVVATPRPLPPGAASFLDELEAMIGVWEFALIASVALQSALCASSWRIYRSLRMAGLYPPGSDPAGIGKAREVSVLEVMCEAEDVELLADCEMNCDSSLKRPLIPYPAATASTGEAANTKKAVPRASAADEEVFIRNDEVKITKAYECGSSWGHERRLSSDSPAMGSGGSVPEGEP